MEAAAQNGARGPAVDLPTLEVVETHLAQLVAPLKTELEQVDAVIASKSRELVELREIRKRISGVLDRLGAPPPAKSGKRRQGQTITQSLERERKAARIRAFIESNATELAGEPFSAMALYERMKEAEPDEPTIGHHIVKAVIEELHDEGSLVVDRIARGGYPTYRPLAA